MKIYLDNCALGRLTDDKLQPRLIAEAQAVLSCFMLIREGSAQWIASAALEEEARRNRDPLKREYTLALLRTATEMLPYSPRILSDASALERFGFSRFDALHIAFADAAGAAALLTTDDGLIRLASRVAGTATGREVLQVEVLNPVNWLARRKP